MDVLAVIQIALFVPFLLLLAILAAVYLTAGYKKGFGGAIISLFATVVAVIFSLLLAKLLGGVLSGLIFNMLPVQISESLAVTGTLGASLVKGILEIAVSFFLFGLFFIISMAVLKKLGKKICRSKIDHLNAGSTGTRLAGMGVRAVDAVLVCVMLLLPLYGTVAVAAPPIAAIMQISEHPAVSGGGSPSLSTDGMNVSKTSANGTISTETLCLNTLRAGSEEIDHLRLSQADKNEPSPSEILEAIANHPVLTPYKYGPGAWINSTLTSFSMNGKTVEISTAANSLKGMLDRIQVIQTAIDLKDEQAAITATQELIEYTRKEVINRQWSYNMAMAFVGEFDNMLAEHADEISDDDKFMELYEQVRPLLDMSFEEYTYNAEGILDFLGWIMEIYGKYGEDSLDLETESAITTEFFTRAGNLMNHSEQAIALKRILLQLFATELYDEYTNNPSDSAAAFINKYFGDGLVAEEDRPNEASAFFSLIDSHNSLDIAEAFVRHPLFGADAVLDSTDETLYIYGVNEIFDLQLNTNENVEEICKDLENMLRNCEKAPYYQPLSFRDQVLEYLSLHTDLFDTQGSSNSFTIMDDEGNIYIIQEGSLGEFESVGGLDKEALEEFGIESSGGAFSGGPGDSFEFHYDNSGDEVNVILTPQYSFSIG